MGQGGLAREQGSWEMDQGGLVREQGGWEMDQGGLVREGDLVKQQEVWVWGLEDSGLEPLQPFMKIRWNLLERRAVSIIFQTPRLK